ncbi:MAG: hypothetical protein AB7I41_24765 [Candidatus Sericytochromatia bacterium]
MQVGNNQAGLVGKTQPAPKTEAPQKQTTLDKGVDWVKEKTQKGTLVGDHYIAAGAGTLVGGTAAIAGVAKIADNVPAVEKALDFVFNKNGKLLAGSISLGASAVLAEDAIQSFKEGSTVKALAETGGAAVTGLGGVELVGRQFNIPVANKALSKTLDFMGDNAQALIGTGAAAGGAAAIKKGVDEISQGNTGKGAAYAAGGAVALLGGGELIGRQFNVPVLKEALTGPAKALFTSKGGMGVAGGAVALTGAGAVVDGARRLSTGKGIVNDAVGMLEMTAGVTAAAGGTTLVGMATGSEKLTQALPETAHFIGATAALGTAVALGKYTATSMQKDGLTYLNAATGAGAALAGLGGVELVADKLGVSVLDKAFTKGWKPVLGAGLAVASYKLGAGAVAEAKDGNMLNAAGQAGLGFMTAAGSAAVLGDALNIPVLDTFGSKTLEFIGDKMAKPVFEFAVKNPGLTLGALAVAGGAGAYAYYNNKGEKEAAQAAEKPAK